MSEPPRIRILFVDDDANVLTLLQATLQALRKEWEGALASSGEQALAILETARFDVVISDMRMPGMTGGELLNQVMRLCPGTARIIMSGYADEESVMATVGAAHQYLPKPFELRAIRGILAKILALNQRLASPPLRQLATSIKTVPSLPEAYFEMLDAMQSADSPIERIAEIISRDPGMSSKLLQLVNSAFFGFARQCSRVAEAVQLLGVIRIRALTLGLQLFSSFDKKRVEEFALDAVWQHCLRTGMVARLIVEEENGQAEMMEQAFTAGMMHDIGKLALASYLPDEYRAVCQKAKTEQRPLHEVETEVLGANHADLGGYFLGLWGLPSPMVEAVLCHHQPSAATGDVFSPLTAVHAANVLTRSRAQDEQVFPPNEFDLAYLKRLGYDHRIDAWRQLSADS